LLAARHDAEGQVIVLSAIPDLRGVGKDAAADALLALGNVLRGSEDLSGAQTSWSKVMLQYVGSPAWPEAVFKLGILCEEKKQYVEAITFFNTLLEAQLKNAPA
jgi:TolA-binding protein